MDTRKKETKKYTLVHLFCKSFLIENSPVGCPLISSIQLFKKEKDGNISHYPSNEVPDLKQLSPAGHRKRINLNQHINDENALAEDMHKLLERIGELPKDESLQLPSYMQDACITIASLERLYPGRWINDDIINFYCLYISKEKFAMDEDTFIIYSTFFYESLTKLCGDGANLDGAMEEKILSQRFDMKRLQRRKSDNLFEKSLIIIPINSKNLHWIILVICYPCLIKENLLVESNTGETGSISLQNRAVYEAKNDQQKKPQMIIFDSLLSMSDDVFQNIRRYLSEEFLRLYETQVDFRNLPGIFADCPQQSNFNDCGIFTLQNIELILENIKTFPDHFVIRGVDLHHLYHQTGINLKRAQLMDIITDIVRKRT